MNLWKMGILFLSVTLTAHAGGPMLIGSPSLGVDGQPFVWDNSQPVQYRTDSGTLGSVMDNATANTHVQQAFNTWSQVPTALISARNVGPILGVTNGHVASVADFDAVYGSCNSGTQTPIIYDPSGTLFAQLIGDASVVGFTAMCDLGTDGRIKSAMSLFTGGSGLTASQIDQVMLHETGHLLGLDHSLPGLNPCGPSAADTAALPIMYFSLTSQTSLSPDDKAWISTLYPSASYNSVYGTVTGQVFFSDGVNAVQDVLVSAHPIDSSTAGENRAIAISSISGYRFTGNPGQPYTADYLACSPASECPHGYYGNNVDGSRFGSRLPALIGWYEIPVPAGSYAVEISSMSNYGQGGGQIGPNNPVIPPPGPGEYWNPHETANDADFTTINCSASRVIDPITVQAGTPTNGINFIMNGTAPTFDIFESSLGPLQNTTDAVLSLNVFGDTRTSRGAGLR